MHLSKQILTGLLYLLISFHSEGCSCKSTYDIRETYENDNKHLMKVRILGDVYNGTRERIHVAKLLEDYAENDLG